jgi:hypothetical protein
MNRRWQAKATARPGDGYRPSGGVGERERPGSAVDHGRSDPLTGAIDTQRA